MRTREPRSEQGFVDVAVDEEGYRPSPVLGRAFRIERATEADWVGRPTDFGAVEAL